jgi:hypothetical protein
LDVGGDFIVEIDLAGDRDDGMEHVKVSPVMLTAATEGSVSTLV